MANTENMSKKGLKEQTYLTLKERMVDCVYPPGSLINEAQLAADLNLSRTPIREAISKLEMEGFVQILPKKGIYVTNITFNDVYITASALIQLCIFLLLNIVETNI